MSRFYNTARWRRLRNWFLSKKPLCAHCLAVGLTVIATQVDHINPISLGGSPTDEANLQGLCDSHHSRKTRAENAPVKKIVVEMGFADKEVSIDKSRKKNKKH